MTAFQDVQGFFLSKGLANSFQVIVSADFSSQSPEYKEKIRALAPLQDSGLQFSISHCPLAGGLAIADQPIGFDIEVTERVSDKVIQRITKPEEFAQAPSAASLWAAKEATFKSLQKFRQPVVISALEITGWGHALPHLETFNIKNNDFYKSDLQSAGCVLHLNGCTYAFFIIRP